DVARVDELAAAVIAEDEGAEARRAPSRSLREATDHELLLAVRLDLQPVARTPTRQIPRVEPLRHDALEALLLRSRVERRSVVEGLRDAHRAVALVEQALQPVPSLADREV